MRYTIRQKNLEQENLLRLFHALVRWSAPKCDRFLLSIYLPHYEGTALVEQIRGLGETIDARTFYAMRGIGNLPPANEDRLLRITGVPGEDFVRVMTSHAAPAGAIAGDESPVEDLWLYTGDRALYSLNDYGRDQIVDVADDEEDQLRQVLASVGLGPEDLYRHAAASGAR